MEFVAHVLFGQFISRFGDLGVEIQEMMNALGVTADGPPVNKAQRSISLPK